MSSIVNPGSTNDTPESLLRKHLTAALEGPGWDAVIAGLATGDATNFTNTHLIFDQLYTITASGVYLDRVTANDGISRPKNVGVSDDIYRNLAIKVTNNKVVNEALLEVLAVYYGEDAVRAHATTELHEPYQLNNGDSLNVIIDGLYSVQVIFNSTEFTDIANATADEVAGVITRAFLIAGVKGFARSFVDPSDGFTKVNVYSGSLGLKGSVQIGLVGGKSQNSLEFPTFIDCYTGTVT